MNKTTMLAIVAVFAAALVAGTLATSVAYADGSTIVKQSNKAKSIASGFGSVSANIQCNNIFGNC